MSIIESTPLPFAKTPEAVGVSSEAMMRYTEELRNSGCHGMMVIRHGKIAAQWFKSPYSSTSPHAMYSVSKSITGIAIGFAVTEGILSLDDKPVDFFPDRVPKNCDENLKKVTLGHLISLTAGRSVSPLTDKGKYDWIDIFMKSKSDYTPGDKFSYINENFHIALAMLRKKTGISTVEYLTPRLFEPLGIPVPHWETDGNGVEAGGWGIVLSATDAAKIALCVLNDGMYDGKQVIPSEWLCEAAKNHKGVHAKAETGSNYGYGYGLWIRDADGYPVRFDGLFGQIMEIHKKYDAVTVVVGGDIDAVHGSIMYRYFPDSFITEDDTAEPSEGFCRDRVEEAYPPVYSEYRSPTEKRINKKTARFRRHLFITKLGLPMSVLPATTTFMSKNKAGNITDVSLEFTDDSVFFSWREGSERNRIECSFMNKWAVSPMTLSDAPFNALASAKWTDENTLVIVIRPLECVCARVLTFTFCGNRVKMKPECDPSVDVILRGVRGFLKRYVKSEKQANAILDWGKRNAEPVHKGRLK